MSLILPAWGFANGVSSLTGTPPTFDVGVAVTAGANNTDGTAVGVLSALTFDCHYLIIGIGGTGLSTAQSHTLLDILTDPAGGTSYSSFINDLACGYTPDIDVQQGIVCWYHFPIYIPAGSSVAVQARTAHTANITTGRVIMYAYGNPSRPEMWWCGQKVESLGINAASSKGTDVIPGDSGADGSWTSIGTSTYDYGAVQYGINGTDGSSAGRGYYWDLGFGSTAFPGAPRAFKAMGSVESGAMHGLNQPIWCNVAAGTVWQLRATCSGVAETFNAAIYGVY